ncbi:MAG TPA: ATP-binding protein [Thermoanaerobaculia bacterium]|nr:ATP-binding protein [Thermoanaerobaculia bacterium]
MAASTFSRRLLFASLVFGLFVLCDIALFGWLIFRSLSQREVERVLLETRNEAERLARQIQHQAESQGKDLYRAIAVEHETQTYIDSVLRQREIVRDVQIRDKNDVLVYQARSKASVKAPQGAPPPVRSPELPAPDLGRLETRTVNRTFEYSVPSIQVPIGDLGMLVIGISEPELARRIEILRGELVRQAVVIGVITMALLLSAYAAVWLLLRRASRLETQAAEAERLAYIGTLASGLAHEIRNPLNSLNLNMQMLEEEIVGPGSAPTGRRLLAITRSEISRLERLVSDFLAYAKPRPLELEEMPAARLLERVLEVLAGEIRRRGVEVRIEDRSGGAWVKVDPAQINQLLLNLAQNALAATEETGRPPVLTFLAYRQGTEVRLEVVDNGVGIPDGERRHIFDLFYSTRKGGTGLGLAIVDRIAKAHGGRVEVRSTPGAGTAVSVALPAAVPEPARERAPVETPVEI